MNKRTFFTALLCLLAALCFVPAAQAAAIKLSATKVVLLKGQTKTLKIKGTKKKVTWKSSKKSVAAVSSKGKITAQKVGKATITAKVAGKTLKCTVIVDKSPKLSSSSLSLKVGESSSLKVSGPTSKPKVTWKSANAAIAAVQNGTVTAKAAGTTTITAKVLGKTLKCTVTVTEPKRTEWKISYTYFKATTGRAYKSGFPYNAIIWYAIVEITNTGNTNLYLDECTIPVLNQKGETVHTHKTDQRLPNVLSPGSKGYFFTHSDFAPASFSDTFHMGTPVPVIEESTAAPEFFKITEKSLSTVKDTDGKLYPKVKFTGINQTESGKTYTGKGSLYYGVIYYNARKEVIGVDYEFINGIFASAPSSFEISSYLNDVTPDCTYDNVADYKVLIQNYHHQ